MAEAKSDIATTSGLQRARTRFFAVSVTRSHGCQSSLVIFIVLRIAFAAAPAIRQYGLGFLTTRTWDPNKDQFGILPEIWGTLYTSVLALVIGTLSAWRRPFS